MNIVEKIKNGLAELEDQEEAIKDPESAYWFALLVPGADIEKCQEAACKKSYKRTNYGKSIKMNIFEKIKQGKATLDDQEEALKYPYTAWWFANYIPGADIDKCQETACRGPKWAYYFAKYVPGANIEKCQEVACKKPKEAYCFARNIKGADLLKIQKLYPEISNELNELIMERALS